MFLHVDGRRYVFGNEKDSGKIVIEDITWDGLFTYNITVYGDVEVVTDEDNINKSAIYGVAMKANEVIWDDDGYGVGVIDVELDDDGEPIDLPKQDKDLKAPDDIVVFGNDEIAVYKDPHTKKFVLSVTGKTEICYEDGKM